jgi:hypothetical protein
MKTALIWFALSVVPIVGSLIDYHKNEKHKNMKCSICKDNIEGFGNNAEPINNGKCCDSCNFTQVIPARLKQFKK